MLLHPCPACRRHVASDATTCPFCAAALARATPRNLALGRVSRAAVFSAGLSACWSGSPASEPTPPDPTKQGSAAVGSAAGSATAPDEVHGGEVRFAQPPDDAPRVIAIDAPPPVDAALPDAALPDAGRTKIQTQRKDPCCKPYGAPPARRRLV